jgi:hypothetical protein
MHFTLYPNRDQVTEEMILSENKEGRGKQNRALFLRSVCKGMLFMPPLEMRADQPAAL